MQVAKRLGPAAITGGAMLAARIVRRRAAIGFDGCSVVITGGSRGLGLVMARLLAAEGARLTLLARDAAELERAREELERGGAEVLTITCDVRDRHAARSAIQRAVQRYGAINVLINNAGVIQAGPVEHMQIEDFEDAMDVHFWAPLYTSLAAVPHMKRQGGGRIVNIASIAGKVATPHLVPYSASKHALVGLSDGMRAELAKDDIHVTTVCPGLMRTGSPINAFFKGRHQAEFAWFSILDALPIASTDARSAAEQILDACRHGDPQLIITSRARIAAIMNALAPGATATMMALLNRFLPAPVESGGNQLRSGWESQSDLSPSVLTRLSDRAAAENNELKGY